MHSSPNKKILIITYYWPPAGGPGVQRWLKFSKYLPEYGFDPVILTVDENQASYAIRDDSLNSEVSENVQVIRTPTKELYAFYLKLTGRKNIPFSGFVQESKPGIKEKLIRFLRTHLFIPDPRKGWNRFAYKKACKLISSEGIQYLVTTSPPHSTQLVGLKLKNRFPDIKWLADFRDPWTHIFFFEELSQSFYSRLRHRKLERRVLVTADKVAVVGHSMQKDFETDHGARLEKEKIVILPNGYDEEDFTGKEVIQDKDFTLCYTGTLAPDYRIDALIAAVKTINTGGTEKVRLRFVGEICDKYQSLLNEELGEQVEIIPPVPHEQSIDYLLRSHMLILVIPDAPGKEAILTGKIFEYLAAQRPILGIGPVDGDAAKILGETDSGNMFGYEDIVNIKAFIKQNPLLLHKKSSSTPSEQIVLFTRKNICRQLVQLILSE